MNEFEKSLLKYLSPEQLEKIQSVKIGIGGAGGLGSNISVILARTGYRYFEVVDFDKIEMSNLNRQHYFIDEVGKPKIEVLKNTLLKINPDIHFVGHCMKWDATNNNKYFNGCDYIIEAFDKANFKKEFVEYYQDKVKYLISGNGMAGLLKAQDIRVTKLNNIFFVGDHSTDIKDGHPPMAPRVTTCAAMMTDIILNLTLRNQ